MFKFPYTNLHELNLDWILEKVKALTENNDEFNDKADYAVETAEEAKTIAEQASQAQIADGAVTTIKLADNAVTEAKLSENVRDTLNSIISKIPKNAKVSIIGDSISSFDGYVVEGYSTFYPTSDVLTVEDMWWYPVIKTAEAVLLKNASYSGSRVTTYSGHPDFYDRSDASVIGNPDVIIVELGANDANHSVTLGSYDFTSQISSLSESEFRPAYTKGLKSLIENFPNAKIICTVFKMTDPYRASIYHICSKLGIECIEIQPYTGISSGNIHPNKFGMDEVASHFVYNSDDTLTLKKGDSFVLHTITGGFVTGSSKNLKFMLPFEKPLENDITGVTISSLKAGIRTVSGAYVNGNSASVEWTTLSGITITPQIDNGELYLQLISETAYTNGSGSGAETMTNNQICNGEFSVIGTFT